MRVCVCVCVCVCICVCVCVCVCVFLWSSTINFFGLHWFHRHTRECSTAMLCLGHYLVSFCLVPSSLLFIIIFYHQGRNFGYTPNRKDNGMWILFDELIKNVSRPNTQNRQVTKKFTLTQIFPLRNIWKICFFFSNVETLVWRALFVGPLLESFWFETPFTTSRWCWCIVGFVWCWYRMFWDV